ncbi:AbiTii domain-containing protein [Mycolicibacterium aurum]|uniref:AbiTii domain-containing protein n=1 Tax=Mycolicibacterium aurum TaxID=1791 RepID=UPI000F82C469|nr:hypothetical protein [Mycolicibacterium aurum]
MADADILKNLRDQVLDESEPLVGLLRKCIALGALTGSEELRAWATSELKGYADDSPLPEYRYLDAPLFVNRSAGPLRMTGEAISPYQIPSDLRQHIPEHIGFRQPVEELSRLVSSEKDSIKMSRDGFSIICAEWTKTLDMFMSVDAMYYSVSGSAIAGMIDMIRTTLLEIVIDMTKDDPLDTLPSRAKVDSVVQVHVSSGDKYEVNVSGSNAGNIGQGSNFSQIQNSSVSKELVDLVSALRATLTQVADEEQRADAEQAIADFEEAVSEENPEPGKIKRRWGWLERIATSVGSAAITQVVKDGTPIVMDQIQLMI